MRGKEGRGGERRGEGRGETSYVVKIIYYTLVGSIHKIQQRRPLNPFFHHLEVK